MAVTLSPLAGAGWQFFDNSGNVLTGGKLYTYAAGTTTPLPTYTTISGDVANSNPIVLNAAGRVPYEIWITLGYGYKFVLKDTNDVPIATWDNIPSNAASPFANDASSIAYEQGNIVTAGAFIVGINYLITSVGTTNFVAIGAASNTVGVYFTATGVGSGTGTAQTSRSVQNKFQETVSVKDFGAKGDGTADDTVAVQNAINAVNARGGGILFFPVGTYKLTNTITLKPGVSIIGEQKGAWGANANGTSSNAPGVVFTKNFTTGDVFYSPISQSIESVNFENFYILGYKNAAGGSNGNGINILKAIDVIFRQVWINGAPQNGFVIGQGTSYHNYLYNCYAFFCGASGYVVQSDWMRFVDCWADGNYVGIDFPNNAYCGSFAHIERCHFEEFELAAIAFQGQPSLGLNGNNNVLHCEIFSRPYTNTPAHGIYFNTGSGPNSGVDNIISGNFIVYQTNYGVPKTGHYGIYVFGGGGVENNIIENNSISGFDEGIVIVSACNQNTIKNNNFYSMNVGISNAGYQTIISENTFNGNTIDLTDTGTYGNIIGNTFQVAPTLAVTDFASSNNMGSIGNWTPSIAFGGASTGITYTTQTGRFEKSGKTVTAYATITLSNKGSATGTATMSLPITAANTQSPGITWVVSGGSGVSGYMFGYANNSDSNFYPMSASGGFLTEANFTNTTSLLITVTYESA